MNGAEPLVHTCYGPMASVADYQLLPQTAIVGVMQIEIPKNGNGTGYTTAPTVAVSGGTGQNTIAHARMKLVYPKYIVNYIYIDQPGAGYGYDDVVTVSLSGGGGTGAVAYAYLGARATPRFPTFALDYGFQRKTTWATQVQRYSDQSSLELMPYQAMAMYQFTLTFQRWTQQNALDFEVFFDQVKGAAFPFYFTAPDDGQVYNCRFTEDPFSYSHPNGTLREGQLVLTTIGDIDNSVDNSNAYPPPLKNRRLVVL